MSTITCNFQEFKQMCKEFLDLLPTSDIEQADNGFKALGIAYFGMTGNDLEVNQAATLLQIIGKKKIEHEIGLLY